MVRVVLKGSSTIVSASSWALAQHQEQLQILHCLAGTCIPLTLFQMGDNSLEVNQIEIFIHLAYTDPKHTGCANIVGQKKHFQMREVRNMSKES